jgi:hypothetical protein
MYCGILWTIFGGHCDYYKELLKIYRILDREECFTIRNAYTREVCTRIVLRTKPRCFGLRTRDNVYVLQLSPGGHYGLSAQCNPDSTSNVPP